MAYLSVPEWDKLQHYKDRTPPWIKLHNDLLESYEFECLPDASKAHLLCIYLLASRTDNKINTDPKWISRKIGANEKVNIEILIKSGFLQLNQEDTDSYRDASIMLHKEEKNACLEESRGEQSRGEQSRGECNSTLSNLADEIFNYWCEVMGKSPGQTKLTAKREKAIKTRLKDGYSIDDIKRAIDGCRLDSFSMGLNDRHKAFNDIELICRSGEKLEGFRDSLTEVGLNNQNNKKEILRNALRDIGNTDW